VTSRPYKANDGGYGPRHFFGRDPRTKALVEPMTDAEIWNLKRGGRLPQGVRRLPRRDGAQGQPTVTGPHHQGLHAWQHFEGRNATHR